VFVADVPVDFCYREVLILIVFPAEQNSTAGIGSGRVQALQELERRLRIGCRIDTIVCEWRPQVHCAAALALSGGVGRPVAGEHLRRWNIGDSSLRVCSLDRVLQTSKEEQLVFDDGPAQHAAELITLESILFGSKRVT